MCSRERTLLAVALCQEVDVRSLNGTDLKYVQRTLLGHVSHCFQRQHNRGKGVNESPVCGSIAYQIMILRAVLKTGSADFEVAMLIEDFTDDVEGADDQVGRS